MLQYYFNLGDIRKSFKLIAKETNFSSPEIWIEVDPFEYLYDYTNEVYTLIHYFGIDNKIDCTFPESSIISFSPVCYCENQNITEIKFGDGIEII